MKNYIAPFVLSICGKYHTSLKKTLVFFIIYSKCKDEDEKIFKEEESFEILKILV